MPRAKDTTTAAELLAGIDRLPPLDQSAGVTKRADVFTTNGSSLRQRSSTHAGAFKLRFCG